MLKILAAQREIQMEEQRIRDELQQEFQTQLVYVFYAAAAVIFYFADVQVDNELFIDNCMITRICLAGKAVNEGIQRRRQVGWR